MEEELQALSSFSLSVTSGSLCTKSLWGSEVEPTDRGPGFYKYLGVIRLSITRPKWFRGLNPIKLSFQWIPSHGVYRSEEADDLVKTGSSEDQVGMTMVEDIDAQSKEILAEINGEKMQDPLTDIKASLKTTSTIVRR